MYEYYIIYNGFDCAKGDLSLSVGWAGGRNSGGEGEGEKWVRGLLSFYTFPPLYHPSASLGQKHRPVVTLDNISYEEEEDDGEEMQLSSIDHAFTHTHTYISSHSHSHSCSRVPAYMHTRTPGGDDPARPMMRS